MIAAARRLGACRSVALAVGLAATALVAIGIAGLPDRALPAVFAVALLLGAVFAWTGFGFAGGFRALLLQRDARAVSASLLIPAVAALAIIPLGTDDPGRGRFVVGIGPMLLLGAVLFGVGMQLANGCGSGTLAAAGQGSLRMWVALPCFCAGGVLGTLVLPSAMHWPELPPIDLPGRFGALGGLGATLGLLAVAALLLLRLGGWPSPVQLRAAALIGALAGMLFLVSGQPWGVTTGLTLLGAKAAAAVGFDMLATTYWGWQGPREALAMPLLASHSALADVGLVLGAWLLASATGQLRLGATLQLRPALGAALGGVVMGVGARLSSGCNIGAFVGGVSSGSLHGFVWLLAVLPGCRLGVALRPGFGMPRH
jgi:hypothetical protein